MSEDTVNDVIDIFDDFIDGLTNELPAPKRTSYDKERFTCEACNGTGKWCRVNYRGNGQCNACNGRGYFVTSKADRMKAKAQREGRAARKADDVRAANLELIGAGGLKWLEDNASWNNFAASLIGQHLEGKRTFTQPQINAAQRVMEKTEATRAAKAEAKPDAPVIDLQVIHEMFEGAMSKGLKRPTYRAEGLVISRAPDHGVNAGALYVKENGSYLGKLVGTTFKGMPSTIERLQVIAENPLEAAVRYGRLTGSCSCCGRELTDPKSIELGIGPVCKDKWGF